jgi:hypothetical protein
MTDPSHICEQCGKLCDTTETSEYETSEAWGAVETHEVRYLVSRCCHAGVEPVRDGTYGEVA